MAVHDLVALQKEAKSGAREAIRASKPTFMEFCDPIVSIDETTVTETDWYADGAWTERTTPSDSPDSEDIRSAASSTEPRPFQNILSVSFDEHERNPGLVYEYAGHIAQTWSDDLDDDFWVAKLSIDAAQHPQNGGAGYAAVGGGIVFFGDHFTMTSPGGKVWTQRNAFSDTLSDTALSAALAARHNYLRPDGRRAARPSETPILWCVPHLFDAARNLLARNGEIYDGTGLQLGAFGNYISKVVVCPGGITDNQTIWGLGWTTTLRRMVEGSPQTLRAYPLMPVVRNNLRIRVTEDTSDNVINVIGHGSKAIHYRPWEGDIQIHKT